MKAKDPDTSHEEIKSLFNYDPESGRLTWAIEPGNGSKIGDNAGWFDKENTKYIRIKIRNKTVMAHRLIWFWMTGEWPKNRIDHKDTIKFNNRWGNLREADNTQNTANSNRRSDNTSGFKGVTFHKETGKWHARIMVSKGKSKSLGLYDCPAAAHFAYIIAADKVFGEFARVA